MQFHGNFEVWPQASECVLLSKHISNKANTTINYKYHTARPNSLRKDVEGHLLSAVQKKKNYNMCRSSCEMITVQVQLLIVPS
jgi:hypothetical protein